MQYIINIYVEGWNPKKKEVGQGHLFLFQYLKEELYKFFEKIYHETCLDVYLRSAAGRESRYSLIKRVKRSSYILYNTFFYIF